MASPALEKIANVVLPVGRRATWAARYGVDPAALERLALASYSDGLVAVADGHVDAAAAVKATAKAMDAVETTAMTPRPLAIGLVADDRALLAAADQDTLVFGQGAPTAWMTIINYLDGRLARLPSAAVTHAAARDAAPVLAAPIVFHSLEPLGLPLDSAIGQVLAGERQLTVAVWSDEPSLLEVWVAEIGRAHV
jgi:hypothetical protein